MSAALARLPELIRPALPALFAIAIARAGARRMARAALPRLADSIDQSSQSFSPFVNACASLAMTGTLLAMAGDLHVSAQCQPPSDERWRVQLTALSLVTFACGWRTWPSLWSVLGVSAAAEPACMPWAIATKIVSSYFDRHLLLTNAILLPLFALHFGLCRSQSSGRALALALFSIAHSCFCLAWDRAARLLRGVKSN